MRVIPAKNSRPTRPWARPWMVWVFGFCAQFVPRLLWDLVTCPVILARAHWSDLRDEVESFEFNSVKEPTDG